MRRWIKVLCGLLVATPAFAALEDQRGNGGGGIVCRNPAGEITSVTTLDVYEAGFRDMTLDFGPASDQPLVVVNNMLDRLASLDPVAAKHYRELANKFFDAEISRFKSGITLPFTEDTGPVAPPVGCALEQIVLQMEPKVAEDRLFTVNKDLFDRLDTNNQAALILHEVIYYELLRVKDSAGWPKHKNSFYARYYNQRILADNFADFTTESYIALFGDYIFDCSRHGVRWQETVIDICKSEVKEVDGNLVLQSAAFSWAQPELRYGNVRATMRPEKKPYQQRWLIWAYIYLGDDKVSLHSAPSYHELQIEHLWINQTKISSKHDFNVSFEFGDNSKVEKFYGYQMRYPLAFVLNDNLTVNIPKGGIVLVNEDGTIRQAHPVSSTQFSSPDLCPYHLAGRLDFIDNRVVAAERGHVGTRGPDQTCSEQAGLATDIKFRADGHLLEAVSDCSLYVRVEGWSIYPTGKMTFLPNDHVETATLCYDANLITHDGKKYLFKAKTKVTFNAEGKLLSWEKP